MPRRPIEGLFRSMPAKKLLLVLVNELSEEEVESLKYKFRDHDFRFLRGDFTREDVLARANITQAQSAILLADTSGQHSLEKADERTILGTLAIKSMAPEVKTCAELLNPENKQHLRRANVDEIIVRGEHIGNLLAGADDFSGITPGHFQPSLARGGEQSVEGADPAPLYREARGRALGLFQEGTPGAAHRPAQRSARVWPWRISSRMTTRPSTSSSRESLKKPEKIISARRNGSPPPSTRRTTPFSREDDSAVVIARQRP